MVIVSSGPYMFEGSEDLSFDPAPEDQRPASGNGVTMATLVRNPSWSRASDPVRAAWPDRIEFYPVDSGAQAEDLIRVGALDVVLNWAAGAETTARWLDDPDLRSQVTVAPADGERYLGLNLALPPFDDLHVRRAVNLAVDRQIVASALGGQGEAFAHQVFTHLALDAYENNLLLSYAPPDVGPTAAVDAAQEEMRQSGYDADGDGRCDAAPCAGLQLWVRGTMAGDVAAAGEVAAQLEAIGLEVAVKELGNDAFNTSYQDPSLHVALRMDNWFKDYASATSFFPVVLDSENVGEASISMVGATPDQLAGYGYTVRSVPNIDDRLAACEEAVFQAQVRCWAELDQYLSEQLVPWVPLTQMTQGWLHSSRVQEFNVDASIGIPMPALDRILVHGEPASPAPTPPALSPVPAIPEGTYRVTLSASDIAEAGGPPNDQDGAGTYTIDLHGGRYFTHHVGTGHIEDPIFVGWYDGNGSSIRFHNDQPFYFRGELAPLTWRVEGTSLIFQMDECAGLASDDPDFCALERAFYTAHPWEPLSDG
jgi:hypothetical protein